MSGVIVRDDSGMLKIVYGHLHMRGRPVLALDRNISDDSPRVQISIPSIGQEGAEGAHARATEYLRAAGIAKIVQRMIDRGDSFDDVADFLRAGHA